MRKLGFYVFVAAMSSSCARLASLEETSPSPSSTPTSLSSCSTQIIDTGSKAQNVAASARGSHADVKQIPGTSYWALAYMDAGAISIKFSYWDGSQYRVEAVSGDSAGTNVRLAFLPDGTPLVFWSNSNAAAAAVIVARRSSAVPPAGGSAAATWTATTVETFAGAIVPRVGSVSISPDGDVMLSYATHTTTGLPRVAWCRAPCTSNNFQTVRTHASDTLVASPVQLGAAWCKSGTSYYPTISYSTAAAIKFGVCKFGTPASGAADGCATTANWTYSTANVIGTASVTSTHFLDATVNDDIPKIATFGTAAVRTYAASVGCASLVAGTTWAAQYVAAGANWGNQWIEIGKDASGFYHLGFNQSSGAATNHAYYKTTTAAWGNNFASVGTWETATRTTYAGRGGMYVTGDSTSFEVVAAYGINNYALPDAEYNVRLAKYVYTGGSGGFTRSWADLTGGLQLATANTQLENVSVASTSTGRPAVAYVDFSNQAATTGRLKFAYRNGDAASDTWTSFDVPGAGVTSAQSPTLKFDATDKPWIAYFDATNRIFYLATNGASDGSASWSTYVFPNASAAHAAQNALPASSSTGLAMQTIAGVKHPVMMVIDNGASRLLRVSRLDWNTRSWSDATAPTVYTFGASGGAAISMDADASGNVVAIARDMTTGSALYAHSSDTSGTMTWSASSGTTVTGITEGIGAMVRINPATNPSQPWIAHFDRTNNRLIANRCTSSLAGCVSGGWQTPVVVDLALGLTGTTPLALATGGQNDQLLRVGMFFESDGTLNLIYPRGQQTGGRLYLARGTSLDALTQTAMTTSAGSGLAQTVGLNFGVSGWNAASAINQAGGSTTAYIGPGNYLYVTSCGD